MREITMNSDGFNIVGCGGCLRSVEVPQEAVLPASVNSGAKLSHPFPVAGVERNAFVARCVVRSLSAVRAILGNRGNAEIGSPVVESIPGANMINLLVGGDSLDLSVHQDACSFASSGNSAGGVVRFGVRVPVGKPVPLHEPFVIIGINCGVKSPGERNKFYGLVRRLLDTVTFNLNFHSAMVAL